MVRRRRFVALLRTYYRSQILFFGDAGTRVLLQFYLRFICMKSTCGELHTHYPVIIEKQHQQQR